MSRRGSGRRLTYRERWARLREWVEMPEHWTNNWYVPGISVADLREQLDHLDRVVLVKARPVRKRKGRTR
jgi:hypothetical protein